MSDSEVREVIILFVKEKTKKTKQGRMVMKGHSGRCKDT